MRALKLSPKLYRRPRDASPETRRVDSKGKPRSASYYTAAYRYQLFPDADFSEELGTSIEPYSWSQDRVPGGDFPPTANRASPVRVSSPEPPSYIPTAGPSHLSVSGDNGYEPIQLLENKLSGLTLEPSEDRFMGESSTVHILQQVKDFGSEYAGREVDERINALRRGGETGPLSEALQQVCAYVVSSFLFCL